MSKIHCLFEFPLNSKQNLADERLQINRSRPVVVLSFYEWPFSGGDTRWNTKTSPYARELITPKGDGDGKV